MTKTKRFFISIFIIIALIIIWFAGIEKSCYIEGCSDCIYQANVIRYRIFGITVHQSTEEYNTIIRTVLNDLGHPCPHNNKFSHYKCKYYGLLICKTIEEEETEILIGNDSWYTEDIARKVKQLGKDDPEFAREFYHQMVELQNYSFWRKFYEKTGLNPTDNQAQEEHQPTSVFPQP